MSFDILREFDTLYAQRPILQPTSAKPSSDGFSFFDSLKETPSDSQARNTRTSSKLAFGDGLVSPQRPSSVQLPISSSYRQQLMTRNKPNPDSSSFNDLIGLFDAPISIPSPVGNATQSATSKPQVHHGINKSSTYRDPFAALAVKTLPVSTKPQSTFWARKPLPIPQQEEVDDDFGDFADASNSPGKTPTVPSRALQDSGNGFRRPLSISTHAPLTNYSCTSASVASNLTRINSDTRSAFSLFDAEDFANTTVTTKHNPTLKSNTTSLDDDFGDFIASPIKGEFPASNSPFSIQSVPSPTINKFSQTPLSFAINIPLSTPATTPLNQITNSATKVLPSRLPLSTILIPFSTIFSQPTTFLFSKLTPHQYPFRQRVFSNPKTQEFLLGTCEAARVAGRIIAGRRTCKLKRNNLGDGDREVQKQDREIAELVRIWKDDCVGRLKATIITPASGSRRKHTHSASDPTLASTLPSASRVPELEVYMKVQKVPTNLGSGSSILDDEDKECLLCGLKRDEIVARLCEHELNGARWWVNEWGHRGCLRWWEEWEGRLLMDAKQGRKEGKGETVMSPKW